MKDIKKLNTPENLQTAKQLREFRDKHPLIYSLEAKKRRQKFANSSIVDSIADEVESYINEGPRRGEDTEIFNLVQQEAINLRQIIEEIRRARADNKLERLENLCYDLAINYPNSLLYQDRTEALMSEFARKKSTDTGLAKSLEKRTAGKKDKQDELTRFVKQELGKDPKISNKELLRKAETGGIGGDYTESTLMKHIKDTAAKERRKIRSKN